MTEVVSRHAPIDSEKCVVAAIEAIDVRKHLGLDVSAAQGATDRRLVPKDRLSRPIGQTVYKTGVLNLKPLILLRARDGTPVAKDISSLMTVTVAPWRESFGLLFARMVF